MGLSLYHVVDNYNYVQRISEHKTSLIDDMYVFLINILFIVLFFTKNGIIALIPIIVLFIKFDIVTKRGAYFIMSITHFIVLFFILLNHKYNIVDLWEFLK